MITSFNSIAQVNQDKTIYKYKATNIYHETKKKIRIFKIINLIIMSYKKFFLNLSSYNYSNFKKKAELMAIN